MTQAEHGRHNSGLLRLNTTSSNPDRSHARTIDETPHRTSPNRRGSQRPPYKASTESQDTIRATATPPINIPLVNEDPADSDPEQPQDGMSFMDHYMRNRKPSVSFNDEVRLDSGQRQSIEEPLERPSKTKSRGRSPSYRESDNMVQQHHRAHSESDRAHYDPETGRLLPRYSLTPLDQPHIGEGRFPLLQSTVDAMARESQSHLPLTTDMTSQSTTSPPEEVRTPNDDSEYALASPIPMSPSVLFTEESKPFLRTASQRWREGQNSQSVTDFFGRAFGGSKPRITSSRRLSRQDTTGSTRSPRSAASSYLRAFSLGSSLSAENGGESEPLRCDSEGQTIGEDFVLGKQIGYGGFSIIREVTQLRADSQQRKLAVKIVRRSIEGKSENENEQAQAEFEHEVELWRFLNHRHILPLEAVYKLDEATFCFIPLNTGGTLFDLIRGNRKGIAPELAISYSYQLASALRYLHLDARVVHRDIKLENCLIDSPPSPGQPSLLRVCDFGMAEWLSNDSTSSSGPPSPNINATDRPPLKRIGPADTSTSAFAGGSLEYAAPEILRIADASSEHPDDSTIPAERSIVSPAVDIWAFGVCVYSLLVGSRPFQNAFQPRVVMAILTGDWDREKVREKGGDEALDLVQSCLEMSEEQRWKIDDVMRSSWLAEAAADDESSVTSHGAGSAGGGWRL